MLRCWCNLALIALITLNCGFAFAEDISTANSLMAGCRAFLLSPIPSELLTDAGYCAGEVHGLGYATLGICIPAAVTNQRAVRVVVKYVDAKPARLREPFTKLAVGALRAAFPCTN